MKHHLKPTIISGMLTCTLPLIAAAQINPARDYPSRPIRLIVPFLPGAGTDLTTRAVAKKLSETWGQQVVADNRPGASGAIGVEITAKATPDGYTLCTISSGLTVLSAVNDKLPYEFGKDITGVSQFTSLYYILTVHQSVPAKSVKELIAHAKASPGKVKQGSSGTAALQHFSGEMLGHMTGAKFLHIPYKGGGGAVAALLSGEVDMAFTTFLSTRALIASGRLRYLAITGAKRSPVMPDLPTIAESGVPGFEVNQWYGAVTSAKVHPAIVQKISSAMRDALRAPDVAERLAADGSTPSPNAAPEFNALIQSDIAKWRRLVKEAGLELK
jgi:tripartite-type tricarboxylate transporter receptor subunit TctC